ncbi:MAG TPA: ATP-binding cassette domain-containing protein [Acidimicrobiales bacterium]|nr:ATP-binding cassette domain-containing protein [Acidimicrobiales bacterium]
MPSDAGMPAGDRAATEFGAATEFRAVSEVRVGAEGRAVSEVRVGAEGRAGAEARAGAEGRPAVEVRGLSKDFGDVKAVRGVDFDVQAGETFGFLGPNGAGKSTTIGMLCTLVRPTSGQATVAGYDVVRQRDSVRRSIGLVFQDPTLDNYLTAEQNLRFHAELYGVPRAVVRSRLGEVLELVGLAEKRKAEVKTFSGGMKRRLEIARGLLHAPAVLFLDEPTIGLDPQTRRSIWDYISSLKQREGTTIFMTTHYMDEAEFCDRIGIIDKGQIVAMGSPEELKASVGKDRVEVETPTPERAVSALIEQFGLEGAVRQGKVSFSVAGGGEFVPRLFANFAQAGIAVQSVAVSRPSLDDVFLAYTGTSIREAEAAGPSDWMRRMARSR